MLANMASSLILHKRINTTTAKAKALRTYIEPLISKAKTDNTHSRRTVFSYLKNKEAVSELFRDVAERVGDRPGGYTRILKTGTRLGDNAEMCFIELVDYNETYTGSEGKQEGTSKRRRRRGGKKKSQKSAGETTQQASQEESSGQAEEQTQAGADTTSQQEQPEAEAGDQQQTENKKPDPEEKPDEKKDKDQSSEEEKKE
jgi:large subunit ribosomal protein L17